MFHLANDEVPACARAYDESPLAWTSARPEVVVTKTLDHFAKSCPCPYGRGPCRPWLPGEHLWEREKASRGRGQELLHRRLRAGSFSLSPLRIRPRGRRGGVRLWSEWPRGWSPFSIAAVGRCRRAFVVRTSTSRFFTTNSSRRQYTVGLSLAPSEGLIPQPIEPEAQQPG